MCFYFDFNDKICFTLVVQNHQLYTSVAPLWAFSLIYESKHLCHFHHSCLFLSPRLIFLFLTCYTVYKCFFPPVCFNIFYSSVTILTETNTCAVSINFKAILKRTFLNSYNIPLHFFLTLNWDIARYATITSKLFPCIQQRTEQWRVIFYHCI